MISAFNFFTLSSILFSTGIFGILLSKKNIISILISLEIILLAAGMNFVSFSRHYNDISGQVMSLFILSVAAAEVAVGLAILVLHFRSKGSINTYEINNIKDDK